MGAAGTIVANGRVGLQQLTGQQRYYQEVMKRLRHLGVSEVVPARRGGAGIAGHAWEQFVLPVRVGKRLLWSPSTTGPLLCRNQVVTIHDVAPFVKSDWFDKKFSTWYRYLLPRLAKSVRRVLTVSDFSRREIASRLGISVSKIVVAGNAVDEKFAPPSLSSLDAARVKYRIERPYVLMVGSVQPRKNVRRLLKAWEVVEPKASRVELLIAGGTARIFGQIGIDSVPSGVRLLGYVPEDDLVPLYGGATAFVYPSLYEGFGIPALEAMACGTPVVTSNSTALPEVVDDAAILVNPECVESIAAGIRQVLDDESLRNCLRLRGLQRAKHFTWDETASRIWKVLQSAANGV